MFRKFGLRSKILLPVCGLVAVAMIATSLLLATWMGNAAEEEARTLATEVAERRALEVLDFIKPILEQARALAACYEGAVRDGGVTRQAFNRMLHSMVAREPSFLGVWACFEPDAFDGRDAQYANFDKTHNASGRYLPYFFRTASGIDSQPCSDPESAKWYTVPRETKKDYLTAPYSFDAGGKTVLGIDSCVPVLVDGRFLGAVGIDYNVSQFMEMAAAIRPFGAGRGYIVADDGSFVGHPDAKMMAKPMSEAFGEQAATIAASLAAGKRAVFDFEADGRRWHRIFVPIDVTGQGRQYWGLGVDIPMDVVLAASRAMFWRSLGLSGGVVLLLCILVWFLVHRLAAPLRQAARLAERVRLGDLSERLEYDSGDEIGTLARALNHMADGLQAKAGLAEAIAGNDLTRDVEVASDKDALGRALRRMSDNLNEVLGAVLRSTLEVDSGAGQVSAASEALSQGATEQAASLEQITSSLTEVSSQTRENAENAARASRSAGDVRRRAEQGNAELERMVAAMQEVSDSSRAIAKIIKVIDEIAFQTNLLALNAAVEAARAGVHGKGFAVVAEEVRNLAGRSAKAARETAELIEGSGGKVRSAREMVEATVEDMRTVVTDVAEVAGLVDAIAEASSEQSHALAEVTQGLQQVDTVTQRNTANAEQTSAAAQELSGQAGLLRSLLADFRLRGGDEPDRERHVEPTRLRVRRRTPQPLPQAASGPGDRSAASSGKAPARGGSEPRDAWGAAASSGSEDPASLIRLDDDEFGDA